jgi:hypothetical protein
MGRTLPSITLAFLEEQESLKRFRRALRKPDQQALDDLLISARQHIAASGYAGYPLPLESFLLSMLLEEHKELIRLRTIVESLVNAQKE